MLCRKKKKIIVLIFQLGEDFRKELCGFPVIYQALFILVLAMREQEKREAGEGFIAK